MNIEKLKEQLIRHEALRLKPYKCSAGKTTIGIGRNLDDVGITNGEARLLLDNDINRCRVELFKMFDEFETLPENIQLVLADMIFNLGASRFRQFTKMIQAVSHEDWKEMSYQMTNSRWFAQVGTRAVNLIKMVNDVNELEGRQDKAT